MTSTARSPNTIPGIMMCAANERWIWASLIFNFIEAANRINILFYARSEFNAIFFCTDSAEVKEKKINKSVKLSIYLFGIIIHINICSVKCRQYFYSTWTDIVRASGVDIDSRQSEKSIWFHSPVRMLRRKCNVENEYESGKKTHTHEHTHPHPHTHRMNKI